MNVWLLKDGENLPVQEGATKMRMWKLAEALVEAGHSVKWWSSTHSHQRKVLLFDRDTEVAVGERFALHLLNVGSYSRNRSLQRLWHHRRLGQAFSADADRQSRPDIIVCAYPFLELTKAAVEYARRLEVPIIVDVRDPWPDALINLFDRRIQILIAPIASVMRKSVGHVLRMPDSLVSCSVGFLEWAILLAGRERMELDRVFHLGHSRIQAKANVNARSKGEVLADLGVPHDATLFTFVGSFGHVYDLETVCNAAELVYEVCGNKVHFILVGDGAKYASVRNRSRSLTNVTTTGWLRSYYVDEILAISDVGLAPCIQLPGCVPNKISEYCAIGLPIISSLAGDMFNLLERYNSGLSYEAYDAEALAEHVISLACDSALIDTLARGSDLMYRKEFDAEKIYPAFVEHIENVAGVGCY